MQLELVDVGPDHMVALVSGVRRGEVAGASCAVAEALAHAGVRASSPGCEATTVALALLSDRCRAAPARAVARARMLHERHAVYDVVVLDAHEQVVADVRVDVEIGVSGR